MVNVASTAQDLSDDYTHMGSWIGLASVNAGDPSGSPLEVPTGAGGYGRAQTTWTSVGGGLNNGTAVTLNAPAGEYNFVVLYSTSGPTQQGDKLIDYCKIDAVLNGDGEIVITPQYKQS
jgi:hypothetical protein